MMPFIDLKTQYKMLKKDIDDGIQAVLDDGRYIDGPALFKFEDELKEYAGVKHVLGCSSGTDALIIPLMAMGMNCGHGTAKPSAVFVPTFTYTASAEVIALVGARPVFVDVDAKTFNMDANSLRQQIEKTIAEGTYEPAVIMTVDLFGQPANYDEITAVAKEYNLKILCDAAQGLGGELNGRRVGSFGTVTGTSFFPAKPLGCYGDGGAIFTDDDELAAIMKSIRTHGTGSHKYEVIRIGMNGRLDTIQAAILSAKLTVFETEIAARNKLADYFSTELSDLTEVPFISPNARSCWAQFVIKTSNRDELQAFLKDRGIPTMIYYPLPMHLQIAYQKYGDGVGSMPVSEALCGEVLALPMHPYMSDETAAQIVSGVKDFFK